MTGKIWKKLIRTSHSLTINLVKPLGVLNVTFVVLNKKN